MACLVVRGIVFCEEQACSWQEEVDGLDAGCVHILGLSGKEPVAAARFRFIPGHVKLERICLRRKWRGDGNGEALVRFMMDKARSMGARAFKMHAQAHLEGFYARMGFVGKGDVFMEAGIPHRMMVLSEGGA